MNQNVYIYLKPMASFDKVKISMLSYLKGTVYISITFWLAAWQSLFANEGGLETESYKAYCTQKSFSYSLCCERLILSLSLNYFH